MVLTVTSPKRCAYLEVAEPLRALENADSRESAQQGRRRGRQNALPRSRLSLSLIEQQPQKKRMPGVATIDRKGIAMREKVFKAVLMLVVLLVLPELV